MRTNLHLSLRFFKLAPIAFMLAPLVVCDQALAQGWVLETADGSANVVGSYTSLALDPSANPHVTYVDETNDDLYYAEKSGGVWTIEAVDALGTLLTNETSLALDASRNPHVSYYDESTGDLKYARKSGSVWTRETPDGSANDVGRYSFLAVDASGNPHVTYYDQTTDDLKYARKSAGVWTRETADGSANSVGLFSSLAIDASGNLHVGYLDLTTGDIKYARKSGGVWTREVADSTANVAGRYISLAVEKASANPHLIYYDIASGNLRYARKSGGVWTIEMVDESANFVAIYNSLALDASGNPHVSGQDGSTDDLKYFRKSGGVWRRETVDGAANGDMGLYSSIELDALGNPHVSYYDATNGALRYAFIPGLLVSSPVSGSTWAVGSSQTISWSYTGGLGTDQSDVFLSVDGGRSFEMIRDNARDFSATTRVPHAPTRFAQIKIVQPSPFVVGYSDSFFMIDATIALAKFEATPNADGAGTHLTWETRPGPEADIRYRVERSVGGGFSTVADALDRGEFIDLAPLASSRYRLIAINGLGEEYVLGETSVAGALASGHDLSVQPNPAPGGSATFAFRAPLDPVVGDAATARVEIAMFDLSGRRIVTLADGPRASGVHTTTWDGRDEAGRDVAAGIYFARLSWNGITRATERVTVVR